MARDYGLPTFQDIKEMTLKELVMTKPNHIKGRVADYYMRLFSQHEAIKDIHEKIVNVSSPEELAVQWTAFRGTQSDNDGLYLPKLSRLLGTYFRRNLKYDDSTRDLIEGHWAHHLNQIREQRKRVKKLKRFENVEYHEKFKKNQRECMKRLNAKRKDSKHQAEVTFEEVMEKHGYILSDMTSTEIEAASRHLRLEEGVEKRTTERMIEYLKERRQVGDIMADCTKGQRLRALINHRRKERYHKKVHADVVDGSNTQTEAHQLVLLSSWWIP